MRLTTPIITRSLGLPPTGPRVTALSPRGKQPGCRWATVIDRPVECQKDAAESISRSPMPTERANARWCSIIAFCTQATRRSIRWLKRWQIACCKREGEVIGLKQLKNCTTSQKAGVSFFALLLNLCRYPSYPNASISGAMILFTLARSGG